MNSHTPGPWTVDVGESSGPGMGSDVVRVDVMKGDQRIAGVTVRPGSRCLSNARLIASAPTMLEALKAALDSEGEECLGRGHVEHQVEGCVYDVVYREGLCWRCAARAAIRAATGEGA